MLFLPSRNLIGAGSVASPGDLDDDGWFRGFNNFGDGLLWNLNLAAKSTEVSAAFAAPGDNGGFGGFTSRTNGPPATDAYGVGASGSFWYAFNLVFSGQTDAYVGAVDEYLAISSQLRPSAATSALFKTGGAQIFTAGPHWTATEIVGTTAAAVAMTTGAETSQGKSTSLLVRPIRRIAADMPFAIGTAMEGGYVAGYFTDLSSGVPLTYMLIVADKATEVTRAYQTAPSSGGGVYLSRTNGSAATESASASTNALAFAYCGQLVFGGKSDWYLPSIDELLAINRLNAALPSGQQLASSTTNYWSSTEIDASNAKGLSAGGGVEVPIAKTSAPIVRPVRRVLLTF